MKQLLRQFELYSVPCKCLKSRLNVFLCKNRQEMALALPEVNFSDLETTSMAWFLCITEYKVKVVHVLLSGRRI